MALKFWTMNTSGQQKNIWINSKKWLIKINTEKLAFRWQDREHITFLGEQRGLSCECFARNNPTRIKCHGVEVCLCQQAAINGTRVPFAIAFGDDVFFFNIWLGVTGREGGIREKKAADGIWMPWIGMETKRNKSGTDGWMANHSHSHLLLLLFSSAVVDPFRRQNLRRTKNDGSALTTNCFHANDWKKLAMAIWNDFLRLIGPILQKSYAKFRSESES